jgi:ubiquinone/menaquinone biosynthesis C-methylase UbiE
LRIPEQIEEEKRGAGIFEETADQWDLGFDDPGPIGFARRQQMDAVVALVGEGPGELLDVGCGAGRLLAALAKRGWTINGIDPAPRMLELAAARLPSGSERLTIGSAEALPFPDQSFDAATAIGVLEWTDTLRALTEMARILRPGGRAVICVRNSRAPATAWRHSVAFPAARGVKRFARFGRPIPARRRRPFSLRQSLHLIEAAGLVVERVENVGCAVLLDPLDRVVPDALTLRALRRAERSPALRRVMGTQRLLVASKR